MIHVLQIQPKHSTHLIKALTKPCLTLRLDSQTRFLGLSHGLANWSMTLLAIDSLDQHMTHLLTHPWLTHYPTPGLDSWTLFNSRLLDNWLANPRLTCWPTHNSWLTYWLTHDSLTHQVMPHSLTDSWIQLMDLIDPWLTQPLSNDSRFTDFFTYWLTWRRRDAALKLNISIIGNTVRPCLKNYKYF